MKAKTTNVSLTPEIDALVAAQILPGHSHSVHCVVRAAPHRQKHLSQALVAR